MKWFFTWESLNAPPRIVEEGISLSATELSLLGHRESGMVIHIQSKDIREVSSVFFFFLSCPIPYFIVMVFKLLTAYL